MSMTPEQFFYAFVERNAEDCASNPGCVRRAFNAAVSASHLADHVFEFTQRNMPNEKMFKEIGDYVEFFTKKTNGAFKDIRSISNAYKHLYADKKKARLFTQV